MNEALTDLANAGVGYNLRSRNKVFMSSLLGCRMATLVGKWVVLRFITGLPYTAIPVGKWVEFLRFIFFRVGKSLACHSPGKWCLCA